MPFAAADARLKSGTSNISGRGSLSRPTGWLTYDAGKMPHPVLPLRVRPRDSGRSEAGSADEAGRVRCELRCRARSVRDVSSARSQAEASRRERRRTDRGLLPARGERAVHGGRRDLTRRRRDFEHAGAIGGDGPAFDPGSAVMSVSIGPALQLVIYEGAGSRRIDPVRRGELLRALLEKGYAVASVRGDVA